MSKRSLDWNATRVAMLREMGLPVQLWEVRLAQAAHAPATAVASVGVIAPQAISVTHAHSAPPMVTAAQALQRPVAPAAVRVPPSALHGTALTLTQRKVQNPSHAQQQHHANAYAPRSDSELAEIATLDATALGAHMRACRACGLCETRRHVVTGVGVDLAQQADILILGEAPGEHEDLQGEPFVGAAGQLLDAMLAAMQDKAGQPLARTRHVYITNTLKCRPPGNRNPLDAELAACAPYWQRQIALLQPKIILALGRFAVQALLGRTEALGRLRAQLHHYHTIPVVVSYHPAYLLRSPTDKAKAWADLCLLMQTWHSA